MRATHREARSYLIAFGDQFLQRPLDVGKATSHHLDNREVSSRTPHRFGASRNMEYGVWRNQFRGQFFTRGVDELGKTLHCAFVVFRCHIGSPRGHAVWSTTRICSSFIRPPCTLNPVRALVISFRSSAVSTSLVDSMFS